MDYAYNNGFLLLDGQDDYTSSDFWRHVKQATSAATRHRRTQLAYASLQKYSALSANTRLTDDSADRIDEEVSATISLIEHLATPNVPHMTAAKRKMSQEQADKEALKTIVDVDNPEALAAYRKNLEEGLERYERKAREKQEDKAGKMDELQARIDNIKRKRENQKRGIVE